MTTQYERDEEVEDDDEVGPRRWKHDATCELEQGHGACGCWWRFTKAKPYIKDVRRRKVGTEKELVAEIDRQERIIENQQATIHADEVEMSRLRHQHTIGGAGIPMGLLVRLLNNILGDALRSDPSLFRHYMEHGWSFTPDLDWTDIATLARIASGERYA